METPNPHNDFLELVYKGGAYIVGILVGLIGLMGRILTEKKKIGKWQIAGIVLISIFIGYQTGNLCDYLGWTELRKILVPVTTMYGQYISYYISQNYQRILSGILDILTNRKKN